MSKETFDFSEALRRRREKILKVSNDDTFPKIEEFEAFISKKQRRYIEYLIFKHPFY